MRHLRASKPRPRTTVGRTWRPAATSRSSAGPSAWSGRWRKGGLVRFPMKVREAAARHGRDGARRVGNRDRVGRGLDQRGIAERIEGERRSVAGWRERGGYAGLEGSLRLSLDRVGGGDRDGDRNPRRQ